MKVRCCFCIPIRTAFELIGICQLLLMLTLITIGVIWREILILLTPMIILYMIMCGYYVVERLILRSPVSAENLLVAYLFLIVLIRNFYFLAMILHDQFSNAICGGELSESNEECHSETNMLLLIISVCGWLIEIFFACVIKVFRDWTNRSGNFGNLEKNGVNYTESGDDDFQRSGDSGNSE